MVIVSLLVCLVEREKLTKISREAKTPKFKEKQLPQLTNQNFLLPVKLCTVHSNLTIRHSVVWHLDN